MNWLQTVGPIVGLIGGTLGAVGCGLSLATAARHWSWRRKALREIVEHRERVRLNNSKAYGCRPVPVEELPWALWAISQGYFVEERAPDATDRAKYPLFIRARESPVPFIAIV